MDRPRYVLECPDVPGVIRGVNQPCAGHLNRPFEARHRPRCGLVSFPHRPPACSVVNGQISQITRIACDTCGPEQDLEIVSGPRGGYRTMGSSSAAVDPRPGQGPPRGVRNTTLGKAEREGSEAPGSNKGLAWTTFRGVTHLRSIVESPPPVKGGQCLPEAGTEADNGPILPPPGGANSFPFGGRGTILGTSQGALCEAPQSRTHCRGTGN
jgi:hypothetical protein